MHEVRALVAAAGRGTRASLPYPKTLFPIQGLPILVRITRLLQPYDDKPNVVVSPEGKELITQSLSEHNVNAELVVQSEPRGMGDAVLRYMESTSFDLAEHVLLIWGDIPFIQSSTLEALVAEHMRQHNDFTFATRLVEKAYTVLSRDQQGAVTCVRETRELGLLSPPSGERDIGLFIFRKKPVFEILQEDLPGKFGKATGEHGFLYVIEHLVKRGYRVVALPIATELDLVSLNSMTDVQDYL
jgi:bifunctional UDP-N-acetylglucosamine pyrophosphorylase/glucosamine-1-phosphate N-acetyltransferase